MTENIFFYICLIMSWAWIFSLGAEWQRKKSRMQLINIAGQIQKIIQLIKEKNVGKNENDFTDSGDFISHDSGIFFDAGAQEENTQKSG